MFIGIDPGVHGGLAVIETGGLCRTYPYERMRTRRQVFSLVAYKTEVTVVVEDVGGIAGDTPRTAFALGQTLGFWEGLLVHVYQLPWATVSPHLWQTRFARLCGDRWCPKDRTERKKYIHRNIKTLLAADGVQGDVSLELADAVALAWLLSKEKIG
jgi:hypothetical protein